MTTINLQRAGKRLFGVLTHAVATVVGLALMFIGLGMGVTVFLIPVAIPLGMFGLGMFLWGLFEYLEERQAQVRKEHAGHG